MHLWFEIVVIALLVAIAIIVIVAAVTHESPDTSSIANTLTRQCHDLGMIFTAQKQMEHQASARFEVQRHEGEMIRRMFSDGVHLNPDPAKKPLSDADVKKILSEARLTFIDKK